MNEQELKTLVRVEHERDAERALADKLAKVLARTEALDSLEGCPPDNQCYGECSALASEIRVARKSALAEHAAARK